VEDGVGRIIDLVVEISTAVAVAINDVAIMAYGDRHAGRIVSIPNFEDVVDLIAEGGCLRTYGRFLPDESLDLRLLDRLLGYLRGLFFRSFHCTYSS
jgi:hypothetical protein